MRQIRRIRRTQWQKKTIKHSNCHWETDQVLKIQAAE